MKKLVSFIYERLIKGFFTKEYWIAPYPYKDDM